jgi:hypothetical protein
MIDRNSRGDGRTSFPDGITLDKKGQPSAPFALFEIKE